MRRVVVRGHRKTRIADKAINAAWAAKRPALPLYRGVIVALDRHSLIVASGRARLYVEIRHASGDLALGVPVRFRARKRSDGSVDVFGVRPIPAATTEEARA